MHDQRVGVGAPSAAERARHRRGDAAADRAGRQHAHHHIAREHQRHAGQRIRAEPRHPEGLDQAGGRLRDHDQHVRPRQPQQSGENRPVEQQSGARRPGRRAIRRGQGRDSGHGRGSSARRAARAAIRARVRALAAGPAAVMKSGSTSSRPLARSTTTGSAGAPVDGVDDDDARPFGREMLVAEGQHRHQHRAEIAAALGQEIFVARRTGVVAPLNHEPRRHQRGEPARQHVGRNAEALLEFVESGEAGEGVAQDEDAPPLADALKAARDRAIHLGEAGMAHGQVTFIIKVSAPGEKGKPRTRGARCQRGKRRGAPRRRKARGRAP